MVVIFLTPVVGQVSGRKHLSRTSHQPTRAAT
jgi:hypothetical protein